MFQIKSLSVIALLFLMLSCNSSEQKRQYVQIQDTNKITSQDSISDNWQILFGLTHNPQRDSIWQKPVNYYIDNKTCSPIAIDFYYGRFRPSDNDSTETLLKLAATKDPLLRPFYRWCLDKTIEIEDGALAEYTGIPARQYAENFPEEFFIYMDSDTTGIRYKDWISSISYSGFYDKEDYQKPEEIRRVIITKMKSNCKNCDALIKERIDQFVNMCFDIDLN